MNSKRGNFDLNREDVRLLSSTHKGKKKFKLSDITARINHVYFENELIKTFSDAFNYKKSCSCDESGAQVHSEPFTCCILPNFIENQEFLEDLQDELLSLDFQEKSNDLYKFHQSPALQNFSSPNISALKNLLYKDFTKWLTSVTEISFTDTVDMTCARYEYTDTLLCHDDELEGRRIAFIFYLVPPWKEEDGGSLDLFDVDDDGQPRNITRSLFPKFNNFVFFEVNPVSFHQVAEVLSKNKCRLSVSGWFHGETISRPPPFIEPRKICTPHQEIEEETFYDWINPLYLDLENQTEIMDRFQDDSEIQLQGFFVEDKYHSLCKALSDNQVKWKRIGPANKRQYEIAEKESLPSIIQECLHVMKSEMMFLLLSNFTALKLHALAPDQDSSDDEGQTNKEEEDNELQETDTKEMNDEKCKESGYTESDDREENNVREGTNDKDKMNMNGGEGNDREENNSGRIRNDKDQKELNSSDVEKSYLDEKGESSKTNQKKVLDKTTDHNIPSCRGDVRRWRHGDYTLLHDTDTEGSEFALDAVIYFNCKDWNNDCGGFTSYLAKGEDEELLSVTPKENCLSLVYRDKDTLRFVKHINHQVTELTDAATCFHNIAFVYYE